MPDIDYGQILEALNDKTDRDMANVNSTGKINILTLSNVDWGNGSEISTFPTSSTYITAPSKGVFCAFGFVANKSSQAVINNTSVPLGFWGRTSSNVDGSSVCILLDEGDTLYFTNTLTTALGCCFYPLKGVN